ncbi:hypothetical protein Gotur_027482 [Gossypium turneri]
MEMHQTDKVLWQFKFQQPIPVALKLVLWLEYIEMWENRYDHIPT